MSDQATAPPPWMPPANPGDIQPVWSQEDADGLVGLLALVGITYLAPGGETVMSQVQFWGRIVSAQPDGIGILCEGKTRTGETMTLPPDLRAFQAANPGLYSLRSTGETVENPDIVTSWTVNEPTKS